MVRFVNFSTGDTVVVFIEIHCDIVCTTETDQLPQSLLKCTVDYWKLLGFALNLLVCLQFSDIYGSSLQTDEAIVYPYLFIIVYLI